MTLRVALGAKPNSGATPAPQIVTTRRSSPISTCQDPDQKQTPVRRFGSRYRVVLDDGAANAAALIAAIDALCDEVEAFARESGGIAVISDRHVTSELAAMPMTIVISAVNQRLIRTGPPPPVSVIVESGQVCSSHHVATVLGFGASAVYSLSVQMRAEEKFGSDETAITTAFKRFKKAAEKSLMKTMGRVGCARWRQHRWRVLRTQLPRHQRAGAEQVLPQRHLGRRRRRIPHAVRHLRRMACPRIEVGDEKTSRCLAFKSAPRAPGTPTGRRRCGASST